MFRVLQPQHLGTRRAEGPALSISPASVSRDVASNATIESWNCSQTTRPAPAWRSANRESRGCQQIVWEDAMHQPIPHGTRLFPRASRAPPFCIRLVKKYYRCNKYTRNLHSVCLKQVIITSKSGKNSLSDCLKTLVVVSHRTCGGCGCSEAEGRGISATIGKLPGKKRDSSHAILAIFASLCSNCVTYFNPAACMASSARSKCAAMLSG